MEFYCRNQFCIHIFYACYLVTTYFIVIIFCNHFHQLSVGVGGFVVPLMAIHAHSKKIYGKNGHKFYYFLSKISPINLNYLLLLF